MAYLQLKRVPCFVVAEQTDFAHLVHFSKHLFDASLGEFGHSLLLLLLPF